ncbi:MAG: aminoacyl-histidine dipeptidase [Acidobacteria bacterium]|nr:aminoacyl-histidine dipeptidase [Acidobacteriota bacterium]
MNPHAETSPPDPDLSQLEPRHLWRRFDDLRRIPRPSKHEEAVRRWVLDFAASHGCETEADAAGNVVVRVPASPGFEHAPIVVLQGHLDMVCEKNSDTEFDFFHDAIRLELDGDRLTARGTTLGADNGVAVAAGLALLTDDTARHGPIELLFTVDEETGLNGARQLDPSIVRGRLLLNLDSEEEGVLTIGCAGARSAVVRLPLARTAAPAGSLLRLRVRGASGGHSGGEIHLGRANAIRVLAEVLRQLPADGLVALAGGSAPNVIPREAEATLVGDPGALAAVVREAAEQLKAAYASTDPNLSVELAEIDGEGDQVLEPAVAKTLVTMLRELPHGVLKMSEALPGLVQTSSNLAMVSTGDDAAEIHCSNRSSVAADLDETVAAITTRAAEAGATVHTTRGYPGWEPNRHSKLLEMAVEVFRRLYDRDPEVSAVHAGLECGILGEKIPGMEMISFGPDIRNPHSPDEFVSVSSVRRVLGDYLGMLLETLALHSVTAANEPAPR